MHKLLWHEAPSPGFCVASGPNLEFDLDFSSLPLNIVCNGGADGCERRLAPLPGPGSVLVSGAGPENGSVVKDDILRHAMS